MNIGLTKAIEVPLHKSAPRTLLEDVDAPFGILLTQVQSNIPTLSNFEIKCLMIQLAYMESDNDASLVDNLKYGRYQVTEYLLKKYGYYDNSGWTGLDGIDEEALFLSNIKLQDKIMGQFIEESYPKLIKAGAIRANDTKEIVAGMLTLAYQFQDAENPDVIKADKISSSLLDLIKNEVNSNYGAVKAKIWRDEGTQTDSQGRPGALYFNAGKYAIQNLAADVPLT